MWNSSRRIALFSTSLILLGAGLFGAAWFAHWLPIEMGEAETGDLATRHTLEVLDALDWSSFNERSELVSDSAPDPFVLSQSEPDFNSTAAGSSFASASDFADRDRWLDDRHSSSNSDSHSARHGQSAAPNDIPHEFPALGFADERRLNSVGSVANSRSPSGSLPAGSPGEMPGGDRRVQQVAGGAQASFGAAAERRSYPSISSDDVRSAPPNLFDAEESPTFGEARGFPTEVAFAERSATLDLFEPEDADEPKETPAFEVAAESQAGQTEAAPIRTAARTVPAETTTPAASGADMDAKLRQIDELLSNKNFVAAHRELSTLYWNNPELKSTILERIEKNAQVIYFSPEPHFLEPYEVQPGDFLQRVAPKYGINWEYLAALNRVDPRRVRAGQKLKVIKGPFSAFVDLSDFELTVHCHGFFVKRYQIGVGRDSSTPVGKFAVLDRITAPQYTDPNGRVIEGGHATNPLGTHWIDLGDSYGIHGTIEPDSIGKAESAGCVRMRNEDVVEVYNFLVKGSEVVIRP
ncbi:MAG: L,D-transpeptidase family protein [Rhodopirellula sp.]|nr:L,D-transpeptidase family protein [Rhodopirellula sp.]